MSALKASIVISRVLLILGLLAAPVLLGFGVLAGRTAVSFLSFAGIALSLISLAWLKSCDIATMLAHSGFRSLWYGTGDTATRWPGATALAALPRLIDYLSAKRSRVVLLLLPPLFFLVGAICSVVFVW